MATIHDQYHDPGNAGLFVLLSTHPAVEEFVKHAALESDTAEQLSDRMFAWPAKRRFPIDTAENTVLSCLFRTKCASKVPTEVDNLLTRAAEVYGVQPLLDQVKEAAATPPALEGEYLLPQHKRLRVNSAADVKLAEQHLLREYRRLGIEDRVIGFTNLTKVAQDFGVQLQPVTLQMAGMTLCTGKVAADLIEARRCATKEPLFKHAYTQLANAFHGRGEIRDRDALVKAAQVLAELDQRSGVDKLYDKKVHDPIQTIFNTTKVAEETLDINGRAISVAKLAALPASFWNDIVGPDFGQALMDKTGAIDAQRIREVVPTLPLDLKIILRHQVP